MKNLIITAAALLLALTIIGSQMELNRLLREKQELKHMADEAASSAALCVDAYAFGQGDLVIDEKKAIAAAEKTVKQNMQGKEVKTEVFFVTAGAKGTAVTVRLSFNDLKETGTYEYVSY